MLDFFLTIFVSVFSQTLNVNVVRSKLRPTRIWVRAKRIPIQFRGPSPKLNRILLSERSGAKLSGLNVSGCS